MTQFSQPKTAGAASGRLSRAERRRQLLDVALVIVREQGADRLTLGYLAARAGVSKPVAYEHFGTRSGLLGELLKSLDDEQVKALRAALGRAQHDLEQTADILAAAYMHCAANTSGDWRAVSAALSGGGGMGALQQEIIDGYVQIWASALEPHSALPHDELHRRCVGLVGAGEAISIGMIGGSCSEKQAAHTFSALIQGGLRAAPQF